MRIDAKTPVVTNAVVTVRNWHVYYLQNSRADAIAYVLQQAFTPSDVAAQAAAVPQTAPGGGTAQVGGGRATPATAGRAAATAT